MDTTSTGQFVYGGISITDWIQAIGALIAIIAGIFAFIKLFLRDKEKEQQIKNLTDIAKQSSMQTQQLSSQAGHMEESNRLFKEQIDVLKERLLLAKGDIEIKEKEREIEIRVRKNNIKPLFYQENGFGSIELLKLILRNKGGECKILRVDVIDGEDLLKIDESIYNSVISKNEDVTLCFRSLDERRNANNIDYIFDLVYENIDGNKYSQRFSCRGISCRIGQPVELD